MSRIKILKNQSLLDIVIQETGDLENAFEIALLNNMSLTDAPKAGSFLDISIDNSDRGVVQYFRNRGLFPASLDELSNEEGIDFWRIEVDFIVQ